MGADAFQIYGGLNLLTAKPNAALVARVPHHLIGEVPLAETSDVARYLGIAEKRIAELQERGVQPIVVGGTGLYVRAITHGLARLPPADPQLRGELSAHSLPELLRRLAEVDPVTAATIDARNPRRVIRALEVCLLTGQPFSRFREQWQKPRFPLRGVTLMRSREEMHERIENRTKAMFQEGVIEEVRAVGAISETAAQALGFREIRAHLAGEISELECIAAIERSTRHYAKRQLTWFRRETAFPSFDISDARDAALNLETLLV